jgi:TetR/AcrR family transcriptional regulator, transcriptional repressor for nem operon
MPKAKQFDEANVLQKARDVFWKKGYNGTSMDELVKATGLSRSSIYATFTDKHGLYQKTLQHYQLTQQEQLITAVSQNINGRKKIECFFKKAVEDSLNDKQRKGCFMLNSTTELANIDKTVSKTALDNMDAMESMFQTWVKEGQTSGDISKRFTARAIARHLFSSINGIKLVAQTKADKATLQDILQLSLSVLD